MKISINANRCEPSPMRKFHPLAVKAKEAGKVRMEGKDYTVQDGDVILFRFNV